MKRNLLIISIAITALTLFAFTKSNSISKNEPYLIIRVIECQGGDTSLESMILIDRGNNKIERIDLKKFNKKGFEANFKIISKKLNEINEEGYKLISSSGGGGGDHSMIKQDYIFKK